MMASSLFGSTNISLYTIPAAWILSLAPHIYATALAGKKFDNKNPRSLVKDLPNDQSIDTATKNKIFRAEAAQQNGFENIGLFAASVVAANAAGVPIQTLNLFSGVYIVSRVAYNLIYITNETNSAASARTGAFLTGILAIMTLFVKAGNRMQALL